MSELDKGVCRRGMDECFFELDRWAYVFEWGRGVVFELDKCVFLKLD